jgi:hypothetical protein
VFYLASASGGGEICNYKRDHIDCITAVTTIFFIKTTTDGFEEASLFDQEIEVKSELAT